MIKPWLRPFAIVLGCLALIVILDEIWSYLATVWFWFSSISPKALWLFVSFLIVVLFGWVFDFTEFLTEDKRHLHNTFNDVSHTQSQLEKHNYEESVTRLLKRYIWQQCLTDRTTEAAVFTQLSQQVDEALLRKLKACLKPASDVVFTSTEFKQFMEIINDE
jgi:hypothetical protein